MSTVDVTALAQELKLLIGVPTDQKIRQSRELRRLTHELYPGQSELELTRFQWKVLKDALDTLDDDVNHGRISASKATVVKACAVLLARPPHTTTETDVRRERAMEILKIGGSVSTWRGRRHTGSPELDLMTILAGAVAALKEAPGHCMEVLYKDIVVTYSGRARVSRETHARGIARQEHEWPHRDTVYGIQSPASAENIIGCANLTFERTHTESRVLRVEFEPHPLNVEFNYAYRISWPEGSPSATPYVYFSVGPDNATSHKVVIRGLEESVRAWRFGPAPHWDAVPTIEDSETIRQEGDKIVEVFGPVQNGYYGIAWKWPS